MLPQDLSVLFKGVFSEQEPDYLRLQKEICFFGPLLLKFTRITIYKSVLGFYGLFSSEK